MPGTRVDKNFQNLKKFDALAKNTFEKTFIP